MPLVLINILKPKTLKQLTEVLLHFAYGPVSCPEMNKNRVQNKKSQQQGSKTKQRSWVNQSPKAVLGADPEINSTVMENGAGPETHCLEGSGSTAGVDVTRGSWTAWHVAGAQK